MCTLLVEPSWLADHLDDPTVRIVDVREPWEYDSIGHLPGAVSIPFASYRDRTSDDPGTLPGANAFAELLGAAGISADDTIVAYDDTHGVFAARFVLTALAYGHEDVRLLDGDFSAWRRTHETTTTAPQVESTNYDTPGLVDNAPIVGTDTVKTAIKSGDAQLIDTREPGEYEEGHLPGAVRLDWMELVDDETRGVKAEDDIESILTGRGIDTDRSRPIMLYCNTSRRLSHTFVVLRAVGFEDVVVYEGSLTAWNEVDGTLETGERDE